MPEEARRPVRRAGVRHAFNSLFEMPDKRRLHGGEGD